MENGGDMAKKILGDPDADEEGEGSGSETEESVGYSLSLLDVQEAYVGLYPDDEEEEAAMNADIGADIRTYIKRLRRLLVLMGVLG